MVAYYNEFDPRAAAWLRELIKAGTIAPGEVDERSIEDIRPSELAGFTQCHFFAGIGGWSYALRLAGWPDDRAVWTGSCPCQPFSAAGKGEGFSDERHLWPAWFHLIGERRPGVVFGEQVAQRPGAIWWDLVSPDLEAESYACGSAVLGAHSVGAFQIRQRRFWVADASGKRRKELNTLLRKETRRRFSGDIPEVTGRCELSQLANTNGGHSGQERKQRSRKHGFVPEDGCAGFWSDCEWIPCRDGKSRPVEPGTFPLAHGVPGRVGLLRGYGNAIVPQVGAAFIEAYLESVNA